ICQVIEKAKPTTVLASASSMGKDLFPRVAARMKTGVVSDAVSLTLQGDKISAVKPLYFGKCFATATIQISPVEIVLMRANQLPVGAPAGGTASVTEHAVAAPDLKTIIKEIVKGTSEKLDLTEANVIVSGGRDLKEAGNFKLLEDLASV